MTDDFRERAEIATAHAIGYTAHQAATERARLAMLGVQIGLDRAAAVQLAALAVETAKQGGITAEQFVIGTANAQAAESRLTPEHFNPAHYLRIGPQRARSTARRASQAMKRFARRVLLRRK